MTRAAMLAVLAACGADAGPGPDAAPDGGAAVDAAPGACDRTGLPVTTELAERDDELGVFFYTGLTGDGASFDRLTVDFYFEIGATDGPQTVVLDGEDLATCATCVLLYRGCSGSTCLDATTYLAQAGTLAVTAMGAATTPFAATLTDARFAEVEIDAGTQHAALVPGGETWCLPAQPMTASIQGPP